MNKMGDKGERGKSEYTKFCESKTRKFQKMKLEIWSSEYRSMADALEL